MTPLELAKRELSSFRAGERGTFMYHVTIALREAGVGPEEIGTSQSELEGLERKSWLRQAKEAATMLRAGERGTCLFHVTDPLREAGVGPEEIGETKASLENLEAARLERLKHRV